MAKLDELQIAVRSKVLERMSEALDAKAEDPKTMYTKSDGTNYSMYQKSGWRHHPHFHPRTFRQPRQC
jgi:hypothetical protein